MTQENARKGLLRDVPLFADCTDDELTRIAGIVEEMELDTGAELVREGSRGGILVVLTEGTAKATVGGEVVRTLGEGDFFGEIALTAGGVRTASVVATSPVKVLVIPHTALQQIEADIPSVRAKIERRAKNRLRHDAEGP